MEYRIGGDTPWCGLEWHKNECRDLLALADLLGVKAFELGVHGSTPVIWVHLDASGSWGRIYHHDKGRRFHGVAFDSFEMNFNPAVFGIEGEWSLDGWQLTLREDRK